LAEIPDFGNRLGVAIKKICRGQEIMRINPHKCEQTD